MARETWTGERLEEFSKRMDERFDGVDQRFREVDRRLEALESKVDDGFASITGRFDRLTLVLIVGLLSILATQL